MSMLSFSSRYFILTPMFASVIFLTLFQNASTAMPLQDEDEIEKTIQQLQETLRRLQQDRPEKKENNNQRVINIGNQSQNSSKRRNDDDNVIQFYDLSDIFGLAPQYRFNDQSELLSSNAFRSDDDGNAGGGGFGGGGFGGGGFGGGPGGVFSFPSVFPTPMPNKQPNPFGPKKASPTPKQMTIRSLSINSMTDVIRNTIDKHVWLDTETDTSIAIIGHGLLITAPTSTHEKIAKLFDLFRKQWGSLRTVSIQAHWIRLSSEQLDKLVNDKASLKIQKEKGVATIAPESWTDFFEKANEENRVQYSSVITAHNSQTSHAVSGEQPRFATNVSTEFSEARRNAPAITKSRILYSQVQTGLALQTTPIATRGGNFVVLDLHCRIIELENTKDEPKTETSISTSTSSSPVAKKSVQEESNDSGSTQHLTTQQSLVQPIAYSVQRLATTVRCPVDHFVLAGGMTQPESKDASGKREQLYLFVKTSVYNVIPDESDRK